MESPLLSLSQRTTASPTLTTLLSSQRRRPHLAPESLRPASQTRAASRIRNGQTPRPLPRTRKKTSSPDLAERPSVSVSASRSNFLKSTSASSSNPIVDEVASAVAEVVEMDLPEVAEVSSVVDVVKAEEGAHAVMALSEDLPVPDMGHATLVLQASTRLTQVLSPAWDHRFSAERLQMIFKRVRILHNTSF
jgi:hypothetical protein